MLFIIICLLLIISAIAICFVSGTFGSAVAFLSLCAVGLVPGIHLTPGTYIFWGVAMVIVVALNFILPEAVARSRTGVPYICVGALAGALLGVAASSQTAIILGSVAGAAVGGIAYGMTPRGKMLDFPSSRFINYLCAKGFPVVITACICGLAAACLLTVYR